MVEEGNSDSISKAFSPLEVVVVTVVATREDSEYTARCKTDNYRTWLRRWDRQALSFLGASLDDLIHELELQQEKEQEKLLEGGSCFNLLRTS